MFLHPDMHMHSNCSDGTDSPVELLKTVKAAGIDIFSLTDHDCFSGCAEIIALRENNDPAFLPGIELSAQDESGRYHILGYAYDIYSPELQNVVDRVHASRVEKAVNRIVFLEKSGFKLNDEDKADLLSHYNPGKPHFVKMLIKKGYVQTSQQGFNIMNAYTETEFRLTPEEAITAVTRAGGIPVLAHGLFADGTAHLTYEETENRVRHLKKYGLMGIECYYSFFTKEQISFMLALTEKYDLMVTAGSDYHGNNRNVGPGQTVSYDMIKMQPFYETVKKLHFYGE